MSWQQALFWVCLSVFVVPLLTSIGIALSIELVAAIVAVWRRCRRNFI
jgi:hypothetical protein